MATVVNVYEDDNIFYLHEVLITRKETNSRYKTGTTQTGTPSGNSSPIIRLLQTLQNVNSQYDTEGNTLTEAQQEYFADSKIRDEDGRLLVVYHGTDYDFNGISNSSMSSFSRTV